jgi:hypothetical protein
MGASRIFTAHASSREHLPALCMHMQPGLPGAAGSVCMHYTSESRSLISSATMLAVSN